MIEITNLSKRFGEFKAVDSVSLDARAGETVALLGPNGSGKTTTLKCLTGLARPDAGRALIGGVDVARQPKRVTPRPDRSLSSAPAFSQCCASP